MWLGACKNIDIYNTKYNIFNINTFDYSKNNNIHNINNTIFNSKNIQNTNNNIFYIKTLNYYKNNNNITQIIIYFV
jgi:hypothetical protein